MQMKYSQHQRGTVAVVVAMTLPILLVAMGWALDFSHVFVNKTRLQNALDATALSAAIAVNGDITHNVAAATAKGKTTFNLFKNAEGNAELKTLNEGSLVFEYSNTLNPWGTFNPATDNFAFVKVKSTNMLNLTPLFIKVFSQFNKDITVPAIATAGPAGNNCSMSPFVLCAMVSPSVDSNCNDDTIKIDKSSGIDVAVLGQDGINDCFGYNEGSIRSLVIACNGNTNNCGSNSLESGNFNLLNLDGSQGGKDIRDTLQSTTNTCLQGDKLNTKPGWTWGNVKQGIDDRFNSDSQITPYPKSETTKVKGKTVTTDIIYNPSPYNLYKAGNLGNNRRILSTPIADCSGLQNGTSNIPSIKVNGKPVSACVFLTEKALNSPKSVNVEFTGNTCNVNGIWNPNNAVLNGPYKIVLFKSPASGDS